MVDVKFSLELDTRCPVPGSYGLDFIATVKMSGGKPDRRFLMWQTRRYDPSKLAATLATVGWQPMKILTYGTDEGTRNLAMLLSESSGFASGSLWFALVEAWLPRTSAALAEVRF